VRAHVEVIDPWSVELADISDPRERWLDLGDRHLAAISERADLVVACLDQEPPDNGTVVELAWAAARGLPVVAYRNDLREGGEEGLRYNLMISAAVRRSGGEEVGSLDELDAALRRHAG
jgi:nucleoside 2-deoxyribosyltransferase